MYIPVVVTDVLSCASGTAFGVDSTTVGLSWVGWVLEGALFSTGLTPIDVLSKVTCSMVGSLFGDLSPSEMFTCNTIPDAHTEHINVAVHQPTSTNSSPSYLIGAAIIVCRLIQCASRVVGVAEF